MGLLSVENTEFLGIMKSDDGSYIAPSKKEAESKDEDLFREPP